MTDWASELSEVNASAGSMRAALAHLHPGEVSTSFAHSLQRTLMADLAGNRRLHDGRRFGVIPTLSGAGQIHKGRNQAAAAFLDGDAHAGAEVLVFVDSDMGWSPDAFEAVVAAVESDPARFPVVGGLCFGAVPVGEDRATAGINQRWFPTLYEWAGDGFTTRFALPEHEALVEVAATGGAFVAIHRSVLTAIRAAEGDVWFDPVSIEVPGRREPRTFGEDMSFCFRARQLGFPTWVHTGAETSHRKQMWVTRDLFEDMRRPSAPGTVVVIPVKDNLAMTRGVVSELEQQGGWDDLVLFDNGSSDPEMVEWLGSQRVAEVVDASDAGGIHVMWNRGVDLAFSRHRHPTVVLLNNDVSLGPQFCQRLVGDLHRSGASVVCGNYDGRPGRGVQPVRGICAGRYDGTGGLAGFAFAVAPEVFESGFRFDETMRWWFGDNDLCLSVEAAGGWYGVSLRAECQHLDGGSQTARSAEWDSIVEADRVAFLAKWPDVTLVPAS